MTPSHFTLSSGETHSPRFAHQVSRGIRFVHVVLTDTAVLFTQVLRHAAQCAVIASMFA